MATDSGFLVWISNYGQIILFFAQIAFWFAVSVAAVWSTLIFRRFVNAKITVASSADATKADAIEPTAAATPISVDEFVD